jgi:hypothetical protein
MSPENITVLIESSAFDKYVNQRVIESFSAKPPYCITTQSKWGLYIEVKQG